MESYNTTKEMLVQAPVPHMTRTYKPVSHKQLIDLTLNGIEKAGFTLDKEMYSAAMDGNIANARFTIGSVQDSEMKLMIGWQNSYNKKLSLKFAIGAHIIVCANGMVKGDMGNFKKKHQTDVQEFTPTAISEYIKRAGDHFQLLQKDRDMMKQIELTSRTRAELIGRMYIEETLIKSTQLNIIAREIETPTHNYNAPESMWELYNYTTYSLKSGHPSDWMDQHIDVHNFFVNEMGALTNRETATIVVTPPQMEQVNEMGTL